MYRHWERLLAGVPVFTPTISGTMVDTNGPDGDLTVGNAHVGDAANRQEMYVVSFDFVNVAGYDANNYAYGVGSRWAVIAVTGVSIPEPSSLALLALSGLVLLRRSRKLMSNGHVSHDRGACSQVALFFALKKKKDVRHRYTSPPLHFSAVSAFSFSCAAAARF